MPRTRFLPSAAKRTRLELANAIFDYLEVLHNCQRPHSSLGMLTPVASSRLAVGQGQRLHLGQDTPVPLTNERRQPPLVLRECSIRNLLPL
jgi:hypothetical protein